MKGRKESAEEESHIVFVRQFYMIPLYVPLLNNKLNRFKKNQKLRKILNRNEPYHYSCP